MVGNIVRFTANGLAVIDRQRSISLTNSAGLVWVKPVSMPSPPAFETADAISASPTHCMPPCTIGKSIPKDSVILVLITANTLHLLQCSIPFNP